MITAWHLLDFKVRERLSLSLVLRQNKLTPEAHFPHLINESISLQVLPTKEKMASRETLRSPAAAPHPPSANTHTHCPGVLGELLMLM